MNSLPEIAEIASNLECHEPGVWFAKTTGPISYPADASSSCFEVEQNSFWFHHRNECIVAVMKRFPPLGVLFDVGGGNGVVSLAIQRAGFLSVLVEPGIHGIKNAKARGLQPLICSSLEQAGFREGTLPAVGLFDVIEHVERDADFLRHVYALLHRAGRIYITAPAYDVLWSCDDNYAGHFRRYTCSSLDKKLRRAGFTVDFASYMFSVLALPVFLLRALPTRLGFRKHVHVEQQKKEHSTSGLIGKVITGVLRSELTLLRRGWRIPFGGSCLLVATANK
jgi:SAM-dependent methyltransferase